MMAWRRSVTMAVSAVLLAVALAGCSAPAPAPTPVEAPLESPTQSAPLFASEEEALAAATEAYERYQAVADEIFARGGENPEPITAVAVGEALEQAREDFDAVREDGLRMAGNRRLVSSSIQEFFTDSRIGDPFLSAYLCIDLAAFDVLDSTGKSVVLESRNPIATYVSAFLINEEGQVVVSSYNLWDGAPKCE